MSNEAQAKEIAEELMKDKEFKSLLVRSMIGYLVGKNSEMEEIKREVMSGLRDSLDEEVRLSVATAKDAVKAKAKNYIDHNVLTRMDNQLEDITRRFTTDYVSKLIMEQFTHAVREKCMDTEVSFKLRDVLDGTNVGRRYYDDD